MNMKIRMAELSGLGLLAIVSCPSCNQTETKQDIPNIVLILADDMGYECVGANGSTYYQTPNLDRLASTGIRFDNCYSQPICTPSRVQIMTGRYNHRNYTRFAHLYKGEITFANMLKEAGYATCIAGKWQLDGGLEAPYHFGFDEYCLWHLNRRPGRYPNPGLEVNGQVLDYTNGEYGPDIVSDYLIDFMERNKQRPFFAYYPMILPHFPFEPTPDSPEWDPSSPGVLQGAGDTVYFKDMVAYVDKIVGKIVDAIEDIGIRENTLIIFTTDNGTFMGIKSPFKDRIVTGGKGTLVNAGTHVPMIVNWPAKIKKGIVNDDLIDFSDFLPTFADLTGSQIPVDRPIDGISFAPQLLGKKGKTRDWIFCWYDRDGIRDESVTQRSAHTQTFRLYPDGRFYDILSDELEKNRLSQENLDPQTMEVKAMLQSVLDEMESDSCEIPIRETGAVFKGI